MCVYIIQNQRTEEKGRVGRLKSWLLNMNEKRREGISSKIDLFYIFLNQIFCLFFKSNKNKKRKLLNIHPNPTQYIVYIANEQQMIKETRDIVLIKYPHLRVV